MIEHGQPNGRHHPPADLEGHRSRLAKVIPRPQQTARSHELATAAASHLDAPDEQPVEHEEAEKLRAADLRWLVDPAAQDHELPRRGQVSRL